MTNHLMNEIELSPHVESLKQFCEQGLKKVLNEALRVFSNFYEIDALVPGVTGIAFQTRPRPLSRFIEEETVRYRDTLWQKVALQVIGSEGHPLIEEHAKGPLTTCTVRIPRFTDRASFIIDGIERVPLAQMVPKQGLTIRLSEETDGSRVWIAMLRPRFGCSVKVSLTVDPDENNEKWSVTVGGWEGNVVELAERLGWDPEPFRAYSPKPGGAAHSSRQPARKPFPKELLMYLETEWGQQLERTFEAVLKRKDSNDPGRPAGLRPYQIEGMIAAIKAARLGNPDFKVDPEALSSQEIWLVGDHLEQVVWKGVQKWFRRLVKRTEHAREAGQEGPRGELNVWIKILKALIQEEIEHFLRGPVCQVLDRTNPLAEVSHKRKVTWYGPGGLPENYHGLTFRDSHPSHYGRLCPVETPETEKLGLTLHLATYARVRNRQIEAPYRCLENGVIEWLSPAREQQSFTTTADPPSEPRLLRSGKPEQELVEVDGSGPKPTWEDGAPGLGLGLGASLIPFIQHDDVNRALMGAKNMKQALPLMKPEVPLVQTGFESVIGNLAKRVIRAQDRGTVTKVTDPHDFAKAEIVVDAIKYSLPEPTEGRLGSRLFLRPIVQTGQQVEKDEVLAEGPAMCGDTLALGTNLLVAYLPLYGYNFEDGIVISDRLVREDILTSLHHYHVHPEEFTLEPDEVTGVPKSEGIPPGDLGQDGVIKKNASVSEGTLLARIWRLSKGDRPAIRVITRTDLQPAGKEHIVEATCRELCVPPGVRGIVEDVECINRNGKYRLRVIIREERRVTVGDKLMGRHGNKGVITRIVPEEEMPHLEDGTPIDVLLNPLGVVGRLNLGQLIETHVGLVIKKKGEERRLFHPFQRVDLAALKQELTECGFPDGKAWLRDGRTGKRYAAPVVVGYQYLMKLNHLAEEKAQGRETGDYAPVSKQAVKGRKKGGGQRVGEMEMWALLAHGAEETMMELFGPRADDLEARLVLQRLDLSKKWTESLQNLRRSVPESFNVALRYLRALGLKVTTAADTGVQFFQGRKLRPDEITAITVELAADEELKKWGERITNIPWYIIRSWEKLTCGCEGYHDQICFPGRRKLCRTHERYIEITKDCTHEGYTLKILHVDQDGKLRCRQCEKEGAEGVIKELKLAQGQQPIRSVGPVRKEPGYTPSGLFGEDVFGPVRAVQLSPCGHTGLFRDLVKEEQNRSGEIVNKCSRCHKAITRITQDDTLRRTKWGVIPLVVPVAHPLTRMKIGVGPNTGRNPYEEDGREIQYIPVLPPGLRPHGREIHHPGSDLNRLYNRVLIRNKWVKQAKEAFEQATRGGSLHGQQDVLCERLERAKAALQCAVDQLMVSGVRLKGRHYRSVLQHLRGKEGLIRQALMGRRIDASGRAVIVSAPFLAPDQVALPRRVAERVFGMSAEKIIALQRDLREELHVILNRQPSLHRYSVLDLRLVLWDEPAIGLPPLVTPGFNADFDGDNMAFYLPILSRSESARRMAPMRHLRSIANGNWTLALSHEIAVGIKVATQTTLPPLLVNAGATGVEWNAEKLRDLFAEKWKKDPESALTLAQEISTLAFGEATRAGLTLSHFDLDQVALDWRSRKSKPPAEWGNTVKEKADRLPANHPVKIYLNAGTKLTSKTLSQMAGGRGNIDRLREQKGFSPILVRSHFYEGVHPYEFFSSAHGSRSSLKDKKLGVAHTGTFTRHLVHTAFDLQIVKESCNDPYGIWLTDLLGLPQAQKKETDWRKPHAPQIVLPLFKRAIGRVAIHDVRNTTIRAGEVIDEEKAQQLKDRVFAVKVRSPLTCKAGLGKICSACYGWDLSTNDLPEDSLWVGIIAGQSIGERATQLTFRTFHTGGAGGGQQIAGFMRARRLFSGAPVDVPMLKDSSTLWSVIRTWETEQAKTPTVRVSVRACTWAKPERWTQHKLLALQTPEDRLSALHVEFHDSYGSDVHEKHAEVILRALEEKTAEIEKRKMGLKGIQAIAAWPEDPAGALAFGYWNNFLAQLREVKEHKKIAIRLDTARARVMLGWPGR